MDGKRERERERERERVYRAEQKCEKKRRQRSRKKRTDHVEIILQSGRGTKQIYKDGPKKIYVK